MKKLIYWKNLIIFIATVVIILCLLYVKAANDQQNTSVNQISTISSNKSQNDIKLTTPKVKSLPTDKFASYIGVKSEQITADFGQPALVLPRANNVEWWVYDLDSDRYLKIGIDRYSKRVCDIFNVGKSKFQGSLRVGLSLKKLFKLTTFYANFQFSYHEQSFQYELSEEALNTHPLISFKNGSYVIVYLKPGSKEIYALEYLNTDMLLKKNLYRLVTQVPIPVQYQGKVDWDNLSTGLPTDFLQQINTKRTMQAQPTLELNSEKQVQAEQLLKKITKQTAAAVPKRYVKSLKKILGDEFSNQHSVFLDKDNLKKAALAAASVDSKSQVFVISPLYNASSIFERPHLLRKLIKKLIETDSQQIGMAYSHGVLVIVVGRSEN